MLWIFEKTIKNYIILTLDCIIIYTHLTHMQRNASVYVYVCICICVCIYVSIYTQVK